MENFDLCLAWNWQYDVDFAQFIETACKNRGLSLLQVTPENLAPATKALAENEITFQVLFDRASDSDEQFMALVDWARKHATYHINPLRLARKAWNKAQCHLAFAEAGLPTPKTIILPAYKDHPFVSPIDLGYFGSCFSLKPAHGGGGSGVITEATSWTQVMQFRQEFPEDEYLLQSYIDPAYLESKQAWFRIIYCAERIFPFWWDTHTHIYTPVTSEEEANYHLQPLREMVYIIHRNCGLDLFSSEIALTAEGRYIIIDYVNDPIDMRLQSKAGEGVPDQYVAAIADRLAELAAIYSLKTLSV